MHRNAVKVGSMAAFTYGPYLPDALSVLVHGSYLKVVDAIHDRLDRDARDISVSRELWSRLGTDFTRWPRVVVAGSKGKGSTSAMLASILAACDERVGLVTSPHLRVFNERIRVDGRCVTDGELDDAVAAIGPAVEQLSDELTPPRYLGQGGAILALAEHIFVKSGVTAVVVEAGRGGEYDEARLVEADVSVLTPMMLEHPDKLGASVEEIAATKSWIVKPGSDVVVAPQTDGPRSVIAGILSELNARAGWVGSDVAVRNVRSGTDRTVFDLRVEGESIDNLEVQLAGRHQAENAAAAVLAARALAGHGVGWSPAGVREGLSRLRWPGRVQLLQRRPWVLLDAAINGESVQHLCEVSRGYPARNITAVVCVPKPKDLDGVAREVARVAQKIIVTEVESPALHWYDDAAAIAARYSDNVVPIASGYEAIARALAESAEEDGVLLVGTISFLGVSLDYWEADTCALW